MNIAETIEIEGFKVNICYDFDPASPREWDNLGKMICWHRRYDLGDLQSKESSDNWLCHFARSFTNYESLDCSSERFKELEDMTIEEAISILEKHIIMLPLYLYDHSGITMRTYSFNDRWDSGQVGYIYVSIADAKKEYGWKQLTKARRKKLEEHLISEVKVYDDYLTGAVYGYQVVDEDDEVLDSCWGFFGSDHEKSGLMEFARDFLKSQKEKVTNETHDSLACAAI